MKKINRPWWTFQIGLLAMVAGFDFVAPCLPCSGASGIPYGKELDAAAIVQDRLGVPAENSLILGNGDINALFFSSGRSLVMRITKNDVWDARLDTADDPELFKVDIGKRQASGGGKEWELPSSYKKPYPCPRACAVLTFGSVLKQGWKPVRAEEGATNTWRYHDGRAVMGIAGKAGNSTGYGCELPAITSDDYNTLTVVGCGTPNAKYFVEVTGAGGSLLSSGWIEASGTEQKRDFPLPAGRTLDQVTFYTWTTDGKNAENSIREMQFTGRKGTYAVDLPHLSGEPIQSRLDLRRAVAEIADVQTSGRPLAIRALAQRNVFLIDSDMACKLNPVSADHLPGAEMGERNGVKWIRQQMPGDVDYAGMAYAVALAEQHGRKAVAVVTSHETKDVVDEAVRLVQETLQEDAAKLLAEHERIWNRYWSASSVHLDDDFFTSAWYRNLYFLRCVSKPGVQAAALYAGLIGDSPPWKGLYTLDYNVEQCFWGTYICNHVELAEPYERLILDYLPRATWFARTTYDCDGAFYPVNLEMASDLDPLTCKSRNHRAWGYRPWTYAPAFSGWAAQNLWLHYLYQPDRAYLTKVAYPVIRSVTAFYIDFLEKCRNDANGKALYGPSFSPEQGFWGIDNCPADIAFTRFTFDAFLAAARILDRDAALVTRCRKQLQRLPDWPVSTIAQQPVTVVDWLGGDPAVEHNVAVPVLPVFPAGVVTWFSPPEERDLFTRTVANVKWNGYNSSLIMSGARARLSMPDTAAWVKTEFQKRIRPNGTLCLLPHDQNGHYTEQFAASGIIAELLLQSVGDIIRIFPAWPKERNAGFTNLRAQGGFLVSAEQVDGKETKLEIISTIGGKLRLLSPWPTIKVNGKALKTDERGIAEMETQPGSCMRFKE